MLSPGNVRTGLVLAALTLTTPAWAADVSKYVPNNSDTVLTVNVPGVLDAPVIKKAAPVLAERYGVELVELLCGDTPVAKKLLKEQRDSLEKFLKDGDRIRLGSTVTCPPSNPGAVTARTASSTSMTCIGKPATGVFAVGSARQ